ncbi:anti-sigma factor family protein [Clostridium senegalense]|uniref:Zf-HC2 domain-containing protein n=1 Tax=Clostridium senegalense TaxID=1465809 RepID=A0A6M0H847_9CLOT|nr:zf-HC2 domain-containing protein [Clostridium senegalense]NEU05752.1 zf-HC2 domain-containing protein [Clostridium senegalense]
MNCNLDKEKISLYINGLLDEKEEIIVKNHISTCEKCKKIYKEELLLEEEFKNICSLDEINLERIKNNVMESIDKNKYTKKKKVFLNKNKMLALSAACLFIVFIALKNINVNSFQDKDLKTKSVEPSNYSIENKNKFFKNIKVKTYDDDIRWFYNKEKTKEFALIEEFQERYVLLIRDYNSNDINKLDLLKNEDSKVMINAQWYNNEDLLVTTGIDKNNMILGKKVIKLNTDNFNEEVIYQADNALIEIEEVKVKENHIDITIKEYLDEKMKNYLEKVETIKF